MLKRITGEDFSYDADAWMNWLNAVDYETSLKGLILEQQSKQNERSEAVLGSSGLQQWITKLRSMVLFWKSH